MAVEIKSLKDGQLGASKAMVYETGDGDPDPESSAIIKTMTFMNTDTTNTITMNLYFKKAAGTSRQIFPKNLSIPPGHLVIEDHEMTLGPGDMIEGDASTASKIDYVISGIEREVV